MPPAHCLSPSRPWRLTQHALERMLERGVTRDEVIAVLDNPECTYGNADQEDVRVAVGGRLRIPYNAETGDVITVARTDQDEEHDMSGWINLDAREAEKLLADWGFEIHSEKGQCNLWTHPHDEQKRLIPFSNPKRGARANGKGSYRTAAQVVGVSVNAFVKGPTEEWRLAAARALLDEVEKTKELLDAPDPLGINVEVVKQKTGQLALEAFQATRAVQDARKEAAEVAEEPAPRPKYSEKHLRQALEAITGDPLTTQEVATLMSVHSTTAGRALNALVEQGKAVKRPARPDEVTSQGNPGVMYLAGPPGTEIPHRARPEPATAQPESPVPTPEPVQESPVSQPSPLERVIDLAAATPTSTTASATPKLFTATGTPWPTGGILIQDEDGVFYVARKLVEEGR